MRRASDELRSLLPPEVLKAAGAVRILKRWPEAVGESLAEVSHPDKFEYGKVWVSVSGSAWAQELRMNKESILARLNEMAGQTLFTDLRFGVRKLPTKVVELPEETADEVESEHLTIREIAERRLQKLRENS